MQTITVELNNPAGLLPWIEYARAACFSEEAQADLDALILVLGGPVTISSEDVEVKLQQFLDAAGVELSPLEWRLGRLLLAADLLQTTDQPHLVEVLGELPSWVAEVAASAGSSGIWRDGRSQTSHYWIEDGAMGLIGDILVLQGRGSRIVGEDGQVRYGPPPAN